MQAREARTSFPPAGVAPTHERFFRGTPWLST